MKKVLTIVLVLLLSMGIVACSAAPEMAAEDPMATMTVPQTGQNAAVEQEQVVYNADGIRIVVKSPAENTNEGTNIRILVENGTDRNIALVGDLFLINGVTVPGYLHAEVTAGTKTNDAVEFFADALNAAGIRKIGSVRGYDTRIVDTDSYEILARVPLELTTVYAGSEGYVIDDNGVELYRRDGIAVIGQLISREFYGRTVRLLVKNETGRDLIVEAEHISVNGYTVDAWLYDTVAADTVRFCQLDLFETGLAENGIDQIEEVSFQLHFLDAHSYDTVARTDRLAVEVLPQVP